MFYVKTTDNIVVQGEDRELTFVLWDYSGAEKDLTDYTATITVRRYCDGGTEIISDQACVVESPEEDGTLTYRVDSADTATWDPGHYYGRIKIENASEGIVEISHVFNFRVERSF